MSRTSQFYPNIFWVPRFVTPNVIAFAFAKSSMYACFTHEDIVVYGVSVLCRLNLVISIFTNFKSFPSFDLTLCMRLSGAHLCFQREFEVSGRC